MIRAMRIVNLVLMAGNVLAWVIFILPGAKGVIGVLLGFAILGAWISPLYLAWHALAPDSAPGTVSRGELRMS